MHHKALKVHTVANVYATTFGYCSWLEQEGVQLHVIGREPMGGTPDPTQSHVSWYVEDLDQATAELEDRGIDMRVMGEGLLKIIWVLDPAGNIVELQSWTPAS